MTTINSFNICNKNISNLFDTLEKTLNKINHIEFNYYKIMIINETLLNENKK